MSIIPLLRATQEKKIHSIVQISIRIYIYTTMHYTYTKKRFMIEEISLLFYFFIFSPLMARTLRLQYWPFHLFAFNRIKTQTQVYKHIDNKKKKKKYSLCQPVFYELYIYNKSTSTTTNIKCNKNNGLFKLNHYRCIKCILYLPLH